MKRGVGGYSLLELLAALALIALLSTLALFAFGGRFAHDRLGQAAHRLASDLRWARHLAITSHRATHLLFTSERSYRIETNDSVSGWTAVAPPVEFSQDAPGIRLSRGGTPQFHPKGIVVPTATFVLENGRETKTVTVSTSGRVRIR
jgi:prepilin-type N-terminal cleavage/methylation domain-containing protein